MADKIINWMSVEEILPDILENVNESEPVLINILYNKRGQYTRTTRIGKLCFVKNPLKSDKMIAWYVNGTRVPEWCEVTHWMPIPELFE